MHQRWINNTDNSWYKRAKAKLDRYDIRFYYVLGMLLAMVISLAFLVLAIPYAAIKLIHRGIASMKLKTLALIVAVLVLGLALISMYGCSKASVKPNDNWQAELKASQDREAAVQSAEAKAAAEAIRMQQLAAAEKMAGDEDVTAQYSQDALYGKAQYAKPKKAAKPIVHNADVVQHDYLRPVLPPTTVDPVEAPKPSLAHLIIFGLLYTLGAAAGVFAVVVLLMYMAKP